jgi:molybdate transport repressor ModE-like protein
MARRLAAKLRVVFQFENPKGQVIMEEGVADLLRAIDKRGCIALASKDIGISYRCALHRIQIAEKGSGTKLVDRTRGDAHNAGSVLTEQCHVLLQRYVEAKKRLYEHCEAAYC